jgi:uncharacterized protein (TIGR02246 family)
VRETSMAGTILRARIASGRRPARAAALALVAAVGLVSCAVRETRLDPLAVRDFATRYTAAWCSQDPGRVASFFAPGGSLKINDSAASVGREEIATAARGFMAAFPDLVVRMDSLTVTGRQAVYRWTLTGTNMSAGGARKAVRISGYEEWTFATDGLIERSLGHFDAADYDRQLKGEPPPMR